MSGSLRNSHLLLPIVLRRKWSIGLNHSDFSCCFGSDMLILFLLQGSVDFGVFQDKYINYQLLSVSIWRAGRTFALFAENLLSSVMVRLGILYSVFRRPSLLFSYETDTIKAGFSTIYGRFYICLIVKWRRRSQVWLRL